MRETDVLTTIVGVVQEIQEKAVSNNRTAYDVVIDGQVYGYGLYAPKFKVGDLISFELDESRGYKNVAHNSLRVGDSSNVVVDSPEDEVWP